MGARLLKEARGLLPAWLATLCLVLAPLAALRLLPLPHPSFLAPELGLVGVGGLALGPLVLSSTTFGREFDDGTFGLLLSQPVSRWRLWWEKTGVLALALATVCGTLLLAAGGSLLPVQVVTGIIVAAYGGGLLCSLLMRQTLGAVCLGAVVPFFLFVTLTIATEARHVSPDGRHLVATLAQLWFWGAAAWAVASYGAALLLFLSREDLPSSPGRAEFGLRLRASRRPGGRVTPWRALVWKELHLQQWSVFLGLALPLLTLIAIALKPYRAQRGASVANALAFAAMMFLTAIVPAVIGTTTVAEERRIGTLAWQRTLPAPHWKQFGLKLGVAWGLGLLCTPWVPLWGGGFVGIVAAVSAIVLLTAFASSLAHHVVEAMALSLAGFLALLVATDGGLRLWSLVDEARWLPLLATLLATAGVLVVLAGWNAREVTVSRRRLWATGAAIVVIIMLARAVSTALAHAIR
jgi:hypothetical protein